MDIPHQPQDQPRPPEQRQLTPHEQFRKLCFDLLTQSRDRLNRWVKKIWKKEEQIDHEETEAWNEAVDYYKAFEQKDNVDYTEAIAHVRQLYERHDKAEKLLDEKADAIIKYLGGGSALITFGALLSIKTDTVTSAVMGLCIILSFLPSLIFGILAIQHAIKVRRPHTAALPPDARYAVTICEHYQTKDKIAPNLWLTLHPLCVAASYRNMLKAKWVEDAYRYYKWAMFLLIVPIFTIAISLAIIAVVKAQEPPKSGQRETQPPDSKEPLKSDPKTQKK